MCACLWQLLPVLTQAAVLDWDKVDWTAGSLSQTYYATNNASFTGNFYYDPTFSGLGSITIAISGNTGDIDSGFPNDTVNVTGGIVPAQQALQISIDSFKNLSQAVAVTISFNNYALGVSAVSFTNFDVDYSATDSSHYTDQIRSISGRYFTDYTNAATLYAPASPTFAITSNSTLNARATGNASNNQDSNRGNVGIQFNTNVTQVSFTYGNGANPYSNPTLQWIAMHDIYFVANPVPEVGTTVAVAMSCGCFTFWRVRRRSSKTVARD